MASHSFPGDEQCKTLKEIENRISNLSSASSQDKQVAVQGIKMAQKLLKCDD